MKPKILIVDDEEDVREYLTRLLARRNFKTISASSGKECLKTAAQERPDLILLDILMPEMNGYTVLASLRSDEATQGIPVIMLTAKRESDSIFESMNLGSTDYLMKPINNEVLLRTIRRYVET